MTSSAVRLAEIAETQLGTRGDVAADRAALYGYLLATDANLGAFEPTWARTGFGESGSAHAQFQQKSPATQWDFADRLAGPESEAPEPLAILRMHSWCAAFVDWCVLQLLMNAPQATALKFAQRPRTASAFGLLQWGKAAGCTVVEDKRSSPERGDIAVFKFSHTGIVVQSGKHYFFSIEGNTTSAGGSNQGYIVTKRLRSHALLKGFIKLPPRR
jgi:hypothetical protein